MLLLRPYNPLIYPAGRLPGFDLTHAALTLPSPPSSVADQISVIPVGSTLLNLLSGQAAAQLGALTSAVLGLIGPVVGILSSGQGCEFTGRSSNSTTTFGTIAAIFQLASTLSAFQNIVAVRASGPFFRINASGFLEINDSGGTVSTTTFSPVVGVPYFAAVSGGASANFVVLNLQNGSVQTFTIASPCHFGSGINGTIDFGSNTTVQPLGGYLAAAWYSRSYAMPLIQMLAWAADPWAFWYPPIQQKVMFSGLKTPTSLGGDTLFGAQPLIMM